MEYVSNVCPKADQTFGFLRRNFFSCPQEVKEAVYKGLVRPVLEYSGSVWDPSGAGLQSSKMFKIERLGLYSPIQKVIIKIQKCVPLRAVNTFVRK